MRRPIGAADVTVNIPSLDKNEQFQFARICRGESLNPGTLIASGENACAALQNGLQRVVRQVSEDAELTRTVLALRGGETGRPIARSEPQPPRA